MTRYLYRCPEHGVIELQHAMADTHHQHYCSECGNEVRRVLVAPHHWWPSGDRPGMENSGNRLFTDPGRLSQERDKLAQMTEEHKAREAKS